jgi:CheY-like chemotaxis protein
LAKILIVEDNALNIKLFCDLLAAHGHQPEAVTDSRNALDAARQFDPDLVAVSEDLGVSPDLLVQARRELEEGKT